MKNSIKLETFIRDEVVSSKDSADFYRIIYPDTTSTKGYYIVRDYYKNGKLKSSGYSASKLANTVFHGQFVEFFQNGKRKSIRNYVFSKLVGDITQYFPNGKLCFNGVYDKNSKLIVNECRDSTGNILAKDGNGEFVKYDDDYKRICAEGKIVGGIEDGEWHGLLKDSAKYTCLYDKGILRQGISYDKNGKKYLFNNTELDIPDYESDKNFSTSIQNHLSYPTEAKSNNTQGVVILALFIEPNGKASNIKVLRGIGSGCDEAAVKAVRSAKFQPCHEFGIPVRMFFRLPINFSLTN